ncbi:MAG: hypothetical protein AAB483_00940 [Patescibacteria group bacterium]
MARVIDLRKQQTQEPEPVVVESAIPHPVVQEQKLLTDSGEALPYHTLVWTAPATYRRHGLRAPYVFAALLAVAAVLIAIFQQDVTTVILFALLAIMTVVHVRRPVPLVEIEVSPLRLNVGDHSYRYEQIKSFWVHYEPEYDIRELSLHLKKWHHPYVKIQIEDQDPVQIRAILLEFIPEEEHEETFIHTLTRRLGL